MGPLYSQHLARCARSSPSMSGQRAASCWLAGGLGLVAPVSLRGPALLHSEGAALWSNESAMCSGLPDRLQVHGAIGHGQSEEVQRSGASAHGQGCEG